MRKPAGKHAAMTQSLPNRVLVLGSNSFSGASFVQFLLEHGVEVIGVSRSAEAHPVFLPYRWESPLADGFRFVRGDLNHDLDALMTEIDTQQPSWIINFAAQSMVAESWQHPEHWFQTNLVSTVRLHERLRHCDYLERYVHVTTPEVYGSTTGHVTESAAFNPSTPYAVSRAAADMSLRTYHAAYGFPVLFTRAANVYGPGQQLYRLIPRTLLFGRLGRRLQLHGGGLSKRSFIHIRDVCSATMAIALGGQLGETYHISTDRIISIRDLVALIASRLDLDSNDLSENVGERLGKDSAYQLDSGKLRCALGWQDQISLEDGISETLAWVDRSLETLRTLPMEYQHRP